MWTWQRCGRYKCQKVLVHTTNPDHLVPSTPPLADVPPLQGGSPVSEGGWVRDEQVATMIDIKQAA